MMLSYKLFISSLTDQMLSCSFCWVLKYIILLTFSTCIDVGASILDFRFLTGLTAGRLAVSGSRKVASVVSPLHHHLNYVLLMLRMAQIQLVTSLVSGVCLLTSRPTLHAGR